MDQVLGHLLEHAGRSAARLYQDHRDEVDPVLDEYGVTKVIAFGSRARADAGVESDLDLAIEVPAETTAFDLVHLQDALTSAFGVEVHVVTLRSANRRLRDQIERDGVVLFG